MDGRLLFPLAVLATVSIGLGVFVLVVARKTGRASRIRPRSPSDATWPLGGGRSWPGPFGSGPDTGHDPFAKAAAELGLAEVRPGRYEGWIHGLPVTIRRLRPALPLGGRVGTKTVVTTTFARSPSLPFRVHGRGPAVVGAAVPTGDREFDSRFVIRSSAGPTVITLFGPESRAAISDYARVASSIDLTDRRLDLVLEGPDSGASITELMRLQARVVEAITAATDH